MTAVLPLLRVEAISTCERCAQGVIVTVGARDGRRKILDPTPILAGLYVLDPDGRAVRRSAVDLLHERTRGAKLTHEPTYDPHLCPRVPRL